MQFIEELTFNFNIIEMQGTLLPGQLESSSSFQFQENPVMNIKRAHRASYGKSTVLLDSSNPSTKAQSQASSDSDPPSFEALPQRPDYQAVGWTSVEVTAELELRRKTVNPSASNLLDVLLRATCAVSPFRKWLEERRKTLSGQYEQELREASIKEVAELRILNKIKGYYSCDWSYLRPIEFLVKLFKTLDSLEGTATHTAGSVFSTCINDIAICNLCKYAIRSHLTLIHLRAALSFRFEREIEEGEYSYLPSKQPATELSFEDKKRYLSMLETQNPKENLQQLLMDCCCRNPDKWKYCLECHRSTKHWEVSELQSLGSGLIVILPQAGSTAAKVPESLNLQDSPVAQAVYNLRAVVIEEKISGYETRWICSERIPEITHQLHYSSVMLFYERVEVAAEMISKEISSELQLTDNTSKRARENVPEDTRRTVNFRYGLQNLGNTCFMNAALNGLFSLHSFRAYFAATASTSCKHSLVLALATFCNKYMQEEVQEAVLQQLIMVPSFSAGQMDCSNGYTRELLIHLDTLLVCQSQTRLSNSVFEGRLKQCRNGKCEPLHDISSALIENWFICPECRNTQKKFFYSRTIDVPVPHRDVPVTYFGENDFYPHLFATGYTGTEESESAYKQCFKQILEKSSAGSLPSGHQTPIELSLCFEYMLRASLMSPRSLMKCDYCKKDIQHFKQSFFRHLSTALIIHIQRFDESTKQKLDTLIAFPMKLNMSEYCANDPRQYVLRGVVYHTGDLQSGHYTACINVRGRWYNVNDADVREVHGRPPIENAYMLFYEQEAGTHS